MHHLSKITTRILGGLIVILMPAVLALASTYDPMAEIKQGVNQVLALFNDTQMPLNVRRERLRELATQHFDFEDMTRSALGYHWRELSPEQRAKFVAIFTTFIQDAYLSKLQDYTVQKIQQEAKTAKINFTKETFDGSDYAEVFSDLILTDQKDPLHVNYMMHRRDGVWLIYDVKIDEISIIANYRNQFNRVINDDGVNQLMDQLSAKDAQLERLMNQPSNSPASHAK